MSNPIPATMIEGQRYEALRTVEMVALAMLLFALPISEALKHLSLLLFMAAWLANRTIGFWKNITLDRWDLIWAAWLASAWISAQWAGIDMEEWDGLKEAAILIVPAWMVSRSQIPDTQWRVMLGAVVAGAAVGSAAFWVGALSVGDVNLLRDPFTFYSIHHFNHSALYLCFALGCAIFLAVSPGQRLTHAIRLFGIFSALLLIVSLYGTTSRNAFATAICAALLLPLLIPGYRRYIKPFILYGTVTLVVFVSAAWLHARYNPGHPLPIVQKFVYNIQDRNLFSGRDRIWRAAWIEFSHHPLAGVGPKNFGNIDLDRLCAWRSGEEASQPCTAERYEIHRHAHSLYFTTLAERGIIGIAALACFLGLAWAGIFRPRGGFQEGTPNTLHARDGLQAWVLVIITIGGVLNTTLLIEHGLLATLLLAIWISHARQKFSGRNTSPA